MRTREKVLAVAVGLALVTALAPTGAIAKSASKHEGIKPLATTYAADTYEAGAGDDTPATARDLTTKVGAYDKAYSESHSLDLVDGTAGDEDWFKFTVTSNDINADSASFLIEAQGTTYDFDTVIDVYGPYSNATFAYTGAATASDGDPLAEASNDDGPWNHDSYCSSLVFRPTAVGTYYARVRPYSWGMLLDGEPGPYTLRLKRGFIGRLAGSDRIKTAIEISRQGYEDAEDGPASASMYVVVANGFNYPDALGGASLAGVAEGPLLLTSQTSLSAGVGAEILRLGAETVYVLGSKAAVSDTVFSQIEALNSGIEVIRLGGDNRIETAVEIAKEADKGPAASKVAIIAYAYNYPDALAATPIAANAGVPILLTGTSTLAPETDAALTELGITDVILMGSTSVISADIQAYLKTKLGDAHVLRMSGQNRYETAKLFAAWSCDLTGPGIPDDGMIGTTGSPELLKQLYPSSFGIASGTTYADALPGGIACGQNRCPLLLVNPSTPYGYILAQTGDEDWLHAYSDFNSDPFETSMIFGGTPTIPLSTGAVLDKKLMQVNAP